MQFDVAIVGGGPVGLAFAGSLSGTGLSVAVVEPQEDAALAAPGFDGREIALTHRSQDIMRALGAWQHIPAGVPSALREARVLNGGSPYALRFDTTGRKAAELGQLVPNHLIRQALYRALKAAPGHTELLTGRKAVGLETDVDGARLTLSGGEVLRAKLVIAADSRFSSLRRMAGIEAETLDFGKAMLVAHPAYLSAGRGLCPPLRRAAAGAAGGCRRGHAPRYRAWLQFRPAWAGHPGPPNPRRPGRRPRFRRRPGAAGL
jgi:2-polyprenyl-6-methoxyphenol hydroxylase-like FAD-dependent oxidoreductase